MFHRLYEHKVTLSLLIPHPPPLQPAKLVLPFFLKLLKILPIFQDTTQIYSAFVMSFLIASAKIIFLFSKLLA